MYKSNTNILQVFEKIFALINWYLFMVEKFLYSWAGQKNYGYSHLCIDSIKDTQGYIFFARKYIGRYYIRHMYIISVIFPAIGKWNINEN